MYEYFFSYTWLLSRKMEFIRLNGLINNKTLPILQESFIIFPQTAPEVAHMLLLYLPLVLFVSLQTALFFAVFL